MKHSESLTHIATALAAAQAEMKAVGKDSINPHFKNRYASLDNIVDAIRPVLAKNGLAVVQGATVPETTVDGKLVGFAVETMLVHTSGEWICNAAIVPVAKPDAQGAGGALTYGRRYGLSALLSLSTDEDDDGNGASGAKERAAGVATTQQRRTSAPSGDGRTVPDPAPASQPASPSDEPPCPKCGGRVWDNRLTKKNPRAPDFKCRSSTCDGVIWPEKKPEALTPVPDYDGPPPDEEQMHL